MKVSKGRNRNQSITSNLITGLQIKKYLDLGNEKDELEGSMNPTGTFRIRRVKNSSQAHQSSFSLFPQPANNGQDLHGVAVSQSFFIAKLGTSKADEQSNKVIENYPSNAELQATNPCLIM